MSKDPRKKIRDPNCDKCPLHESAEFVCLMGSGPIPAEVMIVGEAPGAREDSSHQAFVGPAGKLLDQTLREVGLKRKECYVTNVAKCRPPENRTPERAEIKTCTSAYLVPEWEAVKPRFVLAVGNSALIGVLGKSGITKHRGKAVETSDGTTIFSTYHPAAVLRNPRYGPEFRTDLRRFGRLVRGEEAETGEKTKVKLILTKEHLRWLLRQLDEAHEIAADLETWGVDDRFDKPGLVYWCPDGGIACIGISWKEGLAAAVPLDHAKTPWKDWRKVLRLLKPYLERDTTKIGNHNVKFDAKWLARFGVFVNQTFDSMLMAHMLDENRPKGLKPLSQITLDVPAYDVGEELGDAYNMPLKRLLIYCAKDADYTLRLYHRFKEEFRQEPRSARIYSKLMMPASNVLTKVEMHGMPVDKRRLKKVTIKVEAAEQKQLRVVLKYVPKAKRGSINFNSPQQVADWMFNDLDLTPVKKTKSGKNESTDESVMLQLAKEHNAPKELLKLRGIRKNLSTYLYPWARQTDDKGRIHTTYNLGKTVTGRLSSEKPNLQQVPRESAMRTVFGGVDGWSVVSGDLSQVELRIAAMAARERRMLEAFYRGEDLHLKTAAEVAGVRPEDVTSEQRKKAKAVNFGFLYGMGWRKFVSYAFDNYGVEVTDAEAETFRDRFFELYPGLIFWHNRQRRLAQRYHRVASPLGRIRHLPDMLSGDKEVRAEAERQAINSPIQSCASDLVLVSAVRLDETLPYDRARVIATVHDELLFLIRDSFVDKAVPIIRETMEDVSWVKRKFGADITVPIVAEIKVGTHWGAGKVLS